MSEGGTFVARCTDRSPSRAAEGRRRQHAAACRTEAGLFGSLVQDTGELRGPNTVRGPCSGDLGEAVTSQAREVRDRLQVRFTFHEANGEPECCRSSRRAHGGHGAVGSLLQRFWRNQF